MESTQIIYEDLLRLSTALVLVQRVLGPHAGIRLSEAGRCHALQMNGEPREDRLAMSVLAGVDPGRIHKSFSAAFGEGAILELKASGEVVIYTDTEQQSFPHLQAIAGRIAGAGERA
jgi:hypothetical protein